MFGIRKQDVTYPDQQNLHKQSSKSTNSTVAFQNQRLAAADDYGGYHHYDHHNHLNRTCSGQRWCLRDERSCDLTNWAGWTCLYMFCTLFCAPACFLLDCSTLASHRFSLSHGTEVHFHVCTDLVGPVICNWRRRGVIFVAHACSRPPWIQSNMIRT